MPDPRRPVAAPSEPALPPGLQPLRGDRLAGPSLCEALSACPLFADLAWGEIERLAACMRPCQAPAGMVLFHEGEAGHYLALVLAGEIAVEKADSHASPKTVALAGPGKLIGEMAVIDGEPRSASCRVVQPAILAVLPRARFEQLAEAYPLLGMKILRKLARQLSQRLRRVSGILVDYLEN